MHCVSIARPAFEEQYASDSGAARSPAAEETVTIEPRRSARPVDRRLRGMRNAPVRFVRSTSSEASRGRGRAAIPPPPIPALQTSASRPPNRSTVTATARSASAETPVSATIASPSISAATASIGAASTPRHRDGVPVGREPPRDRRSDPRPAARDEGDLVVIHHKALSRRPSPAKLPYGLEVVDRVGEREAVAAADPHRRERVDLLVRRRRGARASRSPPTPPRPPGRATPRGRARARPGRRAARRRDAGSGGR